MQTSLTCMHVKVCEVNQAVQITNTCAHCFIYRWLHVCLYVPEYNFLIVEANIAVDILKDVNEVITTCAFTTRSLVV